MVSERSMASVPGGGSVPAQSLEVEEEAIQKGIVTIYRVHGDGIEPSRPFRPSGL